jgi:predicted PurR-regulated permease PerM
MKGRRLAAAVIMFVMMTIILIVPLAAVTANLAESVTNAVRWIQELARDPARPAPEWIGNIPLLGNMVEQRWGEWAQDAERLLQKLQELLAEKSGWLIRQGVALTTALFQLLVSLMIVFMFYLNGESAVRQMTAAFRRIAGERTQQLIDVVGKTLNATVYGIIGTALAQGLVAAIGFTIAGFQSPFMLGFLTFFLSLVPVGPPLVWIPASLWLFSQERTGMGIFMAIWGLVCVSGIDNLVKPYLMSRGAKLPFILVFLGVVGGVIAFGFIGVFIGPALLAIGYSLLTEWISARKPGGSVSGGRGGETGMKEKA